MKVIWTATSTAWMLVGALSIVATLFYGTLFFSINPIPWNFPGDPPLFELLAYGGVVAAFLSVPLWLLSRRFEQTPGFVRTVSRLCSLASAAAVLIAALGILERQDPRWSEVRNGIRRYGDGIAAAAGDKHRVLSHEEFERFKQQFVPTPVVVQLRGYGAVRLRMAQGVYPYVGVDFSDASHALFDPTTMWCTYAD